jgi:uncharacterized Fe-S center protein
MAKSKVYFIKVSEIKEKLTKLFDAVYEDSNIDLKNQKIGLKTHFGEKGNTTFPRPEYVKVIADKIKEKNGNLDLIECCVLYKSIRAKEDTHIKLAKEHGFDFAPVVICDGKTGDDYIEVPVNLKHFKSVKVGTKVQEYPFIVGVAHFKGHGGTGFGGQLKNIGMGLGSRAGKLAMHSKVKPIIDKAKCTACGECVKHCPTDAITINKIAEISDEKCIRCAKCIAVCPEKAVRIPWSGASSEELQERVDEYAFGILKDKKAFYFNILVDITPNCDCCNCSETPIVEDIGILGSTDIVAIDQASYDLVNKAKINKSSCLKKDTGDKFAELHKIDSTAQLKYAEKLGLGKREYELVEL